jgi:2-keto-4-pentenoate hydratase/2-oxohepta-3-ene-1,7-dioic acid hydratase in catechol pathway
MAATRGQFLSGVAGAASLAAANPVRVAAAALPAGGTRGLTYTMIRGAAGDTLGLKTAGGIVDVVAAGKALGLTPPVSLEALIAGNGDPQAVLKIAAMPNGSLPPGTLKDPKSLQFAPVVTNPSKIVCVGINYRAHAAETGEKLPPVPELFNKYNTTLNRHGGTIPVSSVPATNFDYEAELVIVMGKAAQNVSLESALDYVFGYTTGNDFTARDLQSRTSQWMLGKTPDHFAPIGPYVVGADLIPDPQTLTIECHVNGEVRQHANTAEMVHGCAKIISYTSQYITLQPGDVIFTGTPQGTIVGMPPDKRVWLKPGDQVETQIEKIGTLHFTLT